LFLYFEAVLKIEVSFNLPLLVHEECGQDFVSVDTGYIIVVALIDKVNKIHCFLGIAIEHHPFLEIHVFLLHLFYHVGEESLHLLLERIKLGEFCVRIIANYILKLSPCHLLAVLVEQAATVLLTGSSLADKARLATIGVNADELALVAINTLWSVSN
jgi:hypothetical protein